MVLKLSTPSSVSFKVISSYLGKYKLQNNIHRIITVNNFKVLNQTV